MQRSKLRAQKSPQVMVTRSLHRRGRAAMLVPPAQEPLRSSDDDQLVLGRRLHGKVGRLFAPKDAIDIASWAPVWVDRIGPIGDEAATAGEKTIRIDTGSLNRAAREMIRSRRYACRPVAALS